MILVNEGVSNSISLETIKKLEQLSNEGVLRRLNLGIFSILWINKYDERCSLYKTRCLYLEPQIYSLHRKIIDIGFLDNWWNLRNKMADYDVEFDED